MDNIAAAYLVRVRTHSRKMRNRWPNERLLTGHRRVDQLVIIGTSWACYHLASNNHGTRAIYAATALAAVPGAARTLAGANRRLSTIGVASANCSASSVGMLVLNAGASTSPAGTRSGTAARCHGDVMWFPRRDRCLIEARLRRSITGCSLTRDRRQPWYVNRTDRRGDGVAALWPRRARRPRPTGSS